MYAPVAVKGNTIRESPLLWRLRRTTLGLPAAVAVSALFFLAGAFYGSAHFRHDFSWRGLHRSGAAEAGVEVSVAHGESGERLAAPISFQVLSWKPRALYFPNFATAEQCHAIIKMAKPNLIPSKVALRKGETVENTKDVRTSSGVFISASEDSTGILYDIEKKIARVTMIPRENGEDFNILRYEVGQRYASHYDAFDPDQYGQVRNQRVASFLLYLSNVDEGGETVFPYENGLNMNSGYDYIKCIGLRVMPRQGDALLFYSLYINGTIDSKSLHGSCAVIKGEKWVATKWLNDQEQHQE